MTREQLQTTADVIKTLLNESGPDCDIAKFYDRVLMMLMYRFNVTGNVIDNGEVYQAPNPSLVWYNSKGKELK